MSGLVRQGKPDSSLSLRLLMGDSSGLRQRTDPWACPATDSVHVRREGRALTRLWSLITMFEKVVFFPLWDEFQTTMKISKSICFLWSILWVIKCMSVAGRRFWLSLMDINKFLDYLVSKNFIQNRWKGKTLPWVGGSKLTPWFLWIRTASLALKAIRSNGIIHSYQFIKCKFRNLP